jgi:hypothetical protein
MYGGRTQDRTRKYADHANWPYPKLVMQRAEETTQATIPVFITVSCLTDSQHVPAASRLGSNGQVTPRPYDVLLATATQGQATTPQHQDAGGTTRVRGFMASTPSTHWDPSGRAVGIW